MGVLGSSATILETMMMTKSKWPLWTTALGAIGALFGLIWNYRLSIQARKYAGFELSVHPGPAPFAITFIFLLGWWLLFVSLIIMSGIKWLRWIAILGTMYITIFAICGLLGIDTTFALVLVFGIGYGMLLIAAIIATVIIIQSWLKKRSKKLPTS
jgi:hypothetical protein